MSSEIENLTSSLTKAMEGLGVSNPKSRSDATRQKQRHREKDDDEQLCFCVTCYNLVDQDEFAEHLKDFGHTVKREEVKHQYQMSKKAFELEKAQGRVSKKAEWNSYINLCRVTALEKVPTVAKSR